MLAFTTWFGTTLLSWILVLLSQPIMRSVVTLSSQEQSSTIIVNSFYVEAVTPFFSDLFSGVLNPFIDVLARSTCQYLQSTAVNNNEELTDYINCDCSASFSNVNGMAVNAYCALSEAICLDSTDRIFCGATNIETDYRRRGNQLQTTACLEIDTGLSLEIDGESPQLPEICLSSQSTVLAQRNIFRIDTCTIRIASRKCQSCTICDGGKDVKFDCSNIQLNSLLGNDVIPGPVLDTCVGIGFIFSNPLFNNIRTGGTSRSGNATAAIP